MIVGVALELRWGCLAMTRGAGLWPASGDGVGHPGSILGALWRPIMVAYVCHRSRAWGIAYGGIAGSVCMVRHAQNAHISALYDFDVNLGLIILGIAAIIKNTYPIHSKMCFSTPQLIWNHMHCLSH